MQQKLYDAIQDVLNEYKGKVRVSMVSDNINVVGLLPDLIGWFNKLKTAIQTKLGGDVQPEKATIYGFGDYDSVQKKLAEQQGFQCIEKEDGFVCAGTPLGSERYCKNYIKH